MTSKAVRSKSKERHYNPLGLEGAWAGFPDEVAEGPYFLGPRKRLRINQALANLLAVLVEPLPNDRSIE